MPLGVLPPRHREALILGRMVQPSYIHEGDDDEVEPGDKEEDPP